MSGVYTEKWFPQWPRLRALEAHGGRWELGGRCCCAPDVLAPFFCEMILAVSFGESHLLNAQLFFRGHAATVIGSGMGT